MVNPGRSRSVALVLALLVSGVALAENPTRLGGEFQVNTYTSGFQLVYSVGVRGDGGFVVVWQSGVQDGSGFGVFGRRFDSAGLPQAVEFRVNSYTIGGQGAPSVAVENDGDFVVAWMSVQDGSGYGIFGRRFNAAGSALAVELQINSYTTGLQGWPDVTVDGDGDFVVAWQSAQDGGASGIFGRRFNAAGSPLATEFQVNTYSTNDQQYASVAADSAGNFVVAWESIGQDGSVAGVFARPFTSSGAGGAEFQVSNSTVGVQRYAEVARDDDGDFVVAWHGDRGTGYSAIFARRFNALAVAQGLQFEVSTNTTVHQADAGVAMGSDGDFVVAWQGSDVDSYGTFARSFAADGTPDGGVFQVNTYATAAQGIPAIGANGGGDFVIAWRSTHDGDQVGVFAQRYAKLPVLDIDGNGDVTALTDGLLVLRFLFGFTGTTLTTGAVGPSCTRCDSAAMLPYLEGLV